MLNWLLNRPYLLEVLWGTDEVFWGTDEVFWGTDEVFWGTDEVFWGTDEVLSLESSNRMKRTK